MQKSMRGNGELDEEKREKLRFYQPVNDELIWKVESRKSQMGCRECGA